MTRLPFFHIRYRRSSLRAVAMLVGAGVLLWRTEARWALGLALLAGGLLFLAVALPDVYAPVSRALDRLQEGTVKTFSWIVLGLVFGFVFIPGRLVLVLSGKGGVRRKEKKNTYWERSATPTSAESFERQF